ncbi:hypothetical protein AXG93_1193s1270 [Marchantia polymorpha subsp. ruderalis]|uniref:Uncharacterized protein n=1 Tax=Marchantia polymorpha subsp. ruderalis TaxID=1480154 RepID=A0A176WKZ5_MARPO|nr:hypothetical protein AXG93_1193s1270 [Marchantia polymorpha subsp. ruderalis]
MANLVRLSTTMSGKTNVAMTLARMALVERSEKISKATEASTTPTSRNVNPRLSGGESKAGAIQANHIARQQNFCLFGFPIREAPEKLSSFRSSEPSIFMRRMFLSLPRRRNGILLRASV